MNKKAVIRFFLKYLLFFLCVSLLIIPSYIKYYKVWRDYEQSVAAATLARGLEAIDNQIYALIELSQTTYADSRYQLLFGRDTPIPVSDFSKLRQVQKNFTNILGIQPLVSDAGIVFRNDTVLTRYRSFFNSNYYGTFYTYNNSSYDTWQKTLYTRPLKAFLASAPVSSSDFGSYDSITFLCPWPSNFTVNPLGIFYSTLKLQAIVELLVPVEIAEKGFILLYDSQGELLMNHRYRTSEGFETIRLQGSLSGIRAEVGIPDSLISQRLAPVRQSIFLYFMAMVLLGILLATFFAYRSAYPIRRLIRTITRSSNAPRAENRAVNEYDYIANALAGLDNTVTAYARTLEAQKDILRIHAFDNALTNGLYSQKAFDVFMKLFPHFPMHYRLASISFASEESFFDRASSFETGLKEEIEARLPESVYVQSHGNHVLLLVLPGKPSSATDEAVWISALEGFQRHITDRFNTDFQIALSQSYDSLKSLPEALVQLRSLMRTAVSHPGAFTVLQRKSGIPGTASYPLLDLNRMQQVYTALLAGDGETVDSLLHMTLASIQEAGYLEESETEQVFKNFRSILLQVKSESPDPLETVFIPSYDPSLHITPLFASLATACQAICTKIGEEREKSKTAFTHLVCRFIQENIGSQELYAKMVATRFGISETTLQKIIRTASGKTFFDYVEDLRLEKAHGLLTESSMMINAIAEACGFSSSNSFYKAFKRRYGQPPGTFRKVLDKS